MKRRFWLLALFCLLLAGCGSNTDQVAVKLSDLKPLPAPPQREVKPLRVSVAAVISPQGTNTSYQPLLDYLGDKLKRPVELVQRRTYTETNNLVESGEVDLAFVCTSAYVLGHDKFDMQLLVAPRVKGATTYNSLLIVKVDNPARSISDLEGKVFAFTDPVSNSGRVYPTYLVEQMGKTPDQFFSRVFFTYNHDNAIRAVASGLADGAAVDSMVYDYALQNDPTLASQVRVIQRSPDFGIPPVVVGPKISPQLKALLEEILLGMQNDPAGQAALGLLGISAFVPIDDSAYDSARELVKEVGPLTP
ncbi:MAG TPA: phosphate/phosphite/phosphonate ABC transporter substrate-binding protein [Chloroflexia bacterium]|nr:phosphate/phosphite/phosphonate ABC transporter substrate-binding protein [Chloroflexia bacterium]